MSSAETLYTFRISTPNYLERARAQVVKMPAYRDGALAAPTQAGSTFSLYDDSNSAVIDAQAVTVSGSIAQYTIQAADIPATLDLAEGWREEWTLVMPDGTTRTVRRDAGLCLRLLYPVVTLADLLERHRKLQKAGATAGILPNDDPAAQGYLDHAWITIHNRIVSLGRRPYLIMSPWSLKECHETLALHLIYRDARSNAGDGRYKTEADEYKKDFETAWAALTFKYDDDQDGADDGVNRVAAQPVVSLNTPPRWW